MNTRRLLRAGLTAGVLSCAGLLAACGGDAPVTTTEQTTTTTTAPTPMPMPPPAATTTTTTHTQSGY